MSLFNSGDRVQLAYPDEEDLNHGLRAGAIGTVLEVDNVPFVRWDGFTGGHDGNGLDRMDPTGPRDVWAVMADQLKAAPQG